MAELTTKIIEYNTQFTSRKVYLNLPNEILA